jgi:hypothetical protein
VGVPAVRRERGLVPETVRELEEIHAAFDHPRGVRVAEVVNALPLISQAATNCRIYTHVLW